MTLNLSIRRPYCLGEGDLVSTLDLAESNYISCLTIFRYFLLATVGGRGTNHPQEAHPPDFTSQEATYRRNTKQIGQAPTSKLS